MFMPEHVVESNPGKLLIADPLSEARGRQNSKPQEVKQCHNGKLRNYHTGVVPSSGKSETHPNAASDSGSVLLPD